MHSYRILHPTMHANRRDTSWRDERDVPSPDRASDWVGEAAFAGHIAVWSWPVVDARALLVPGLELGEPPFQWREQDGQHPVIFAYGEQTCSVNFFAGFAVRSGLAYHEAGILVPFVRRRGRRGSLVTFVPRMYADFFPPVWHDQASYGFGKRLVEFRREGPLRLCIGARGRVLLELSAEPRGDREPGATCSEPALEVIRAAASLPIVGRMTDGTLVGSHFSWDFRRATLRAADSTVELHAGVIDGLQVRTCPDVRGGTFEVEHLVWRLGWPGRCEV